MSWYAAFKARTAAQSVNSVKSLNDEIADDETAERAAIQAEPSLPAIGTPERERFDRIQRETLAGLLLVADATRFGLAAPEMRATDGTKHDL